MLRVLCGALLISLAGLAEGRIYCSNHNFETSHDTPHMQFTKEVVDEDYAVEGDFKSLHCCAKGYRSIEWFKDGKQYPWSQEETSSLILYPEAANQTVYARKASKIDEGRYTCVLRNATHTLEHHIDLRVKSSSPDIPLATFRPTDQFANIDGSARFYCEAFVGKKVLPDIALSIRWYHTSEHASSSGGSGSDGENGDEIRAVEEGEGTEDGGSCSTEVVYREDEQIIGSYLRIGRVTANHFGRYLCRVEMGNSRKHRLEMAASLINALPIDFEAISLLTNPFMLGTLAAIVALVVFFLTLRCVQAWWLRRMGVALSKKEEEALKLKNRQLSALQHFSRQPTDCVKVQITSSNT